MYTKFDEKVMQDVMAIARKALDADDMSLLTKEQAWYLLGCRNRDFVAEDGTIQNSEYYFTLREWNDIEEYRYRKD